MRQKPIAARRATAVETGGAIFVLIYLACLMLLGLPVMMMEFSLSLCCDSQKSLVHALCSDVTVLSHIRILGLSIMDLEDFLVSSILLSFASLRLVLFCVSFYGWNWKTSSRKLIPETVRRLQTGCGYT